MKLKLNHAQALPRPGLSFPQFSVEELEIRFPGEQTDGVMTR